MVGRSGQLDVQSRAQPAIRLVRRRYENGRCLRSLSPGDGRPLPGAPEHQRILLPPLTAMPCNNIDLPTSRREFLRRAGCGFGAVALAALLRETALATPEE